MPEGWFYSALTGIASVYQWEVVATEFDPAKVDYGTFGGGANEETLLN